MERYWNKGIAETILSQLGGRMFIVMTGAKNILAHPDGLSFRIGRNSHAVTQVKITLNREDLYDLDFGFIRKHEFRIKNSAKSVFAEDLQNVFTRFTGMDTGGIH